MIAPALTRRLRGENVPDVYAWTVNDEASVRRVANHGVHGIVTDEPEEARVRPRSLDVRRPVWKKKSRRSRPRAATGGCGPRERLRASASEEKDVAGEARRDEG